MTDTAETRAARLTQLAALLSRADRLTVDEAALLRRHVAAELDAAELASRTAGGMQRANRRLRQQLAAAEDDRDDARDDARAEAGRLRASVEHIAAAPLNGDVWARIGMELGWTPERAGTEARKRRLHGERLLAHGADQAREDAEALRQQLATAKADADRYREEEVGACQTIAAMHAAAVGEVRGPLLGVVEDVASLRTAYLAQQDRADQLNRLCREQRKRANAAEQALTASEADRNRHHKYAVKAAQRLDGHRRALAAVLARSGDTPFAELTEYAARTLTRSGERLLAADKAAAEVDATLQRVRDADSLGAALAAVAEHDGIAPTSARLQGAYAEAAETVEARLAEQQRAHEISHASWQQAYRECGAVVVEQRTRADLAEQRLAAAHNLASAQGETIGRLLLADRAAEQRADRTIRLLQRNIRATEARADRNFTAWRSARRRAAAEQAANAMRDARMRHAVQQYAEVRVQLDDTEAALSTLRGGIREAGGDPTSIQNVYAQLIMWRRRAQAAEAALTHARQAEADSDHTCPDGEPCPPHDALAEDDSLDEMTITDDPNDPEQVRVHLPVFSYLDTQAWSVDVGIPRSHLQHLARIAAAVQVASSGQDTGQ